MKINWKVRLKNKTFWVTAVPALFLVLQYVLALFGITLDLEGVQAAVLDVIEAVFILLTALGVVVDHTTAGLGDGTLGLSYDEPQK
ncbi:MAG: phage holin [Alistipes sp.]|nr:phage holin [Alistipes sp.]